MAPATGSTFSGPPAEMLRDEGMAQGVVINGLPIMNDRPTFGRPQPTNLDLYFRDRVIGGLEAFFIVSTDLNSFYHAISGKLIREIA